MTVYHARYWESVQAGSRIDTMVELPLRRSVDAGMFALYRSHIYSVEQVQVEPGFGRAARHEDLSQESGGTI